MPMIIPNEFNYSAIQGAIPNGSTSLDINVAPQAPSYSMAAGGSIIVFDLPSRGGMIIPDSMSLRYKYAITSTGESKIKCTPCYSFFSKLQTDLAGNTAEIINDYNVVANLMVNCTQNVAVKYGNAPSYGWKTDNDQVANWETHDSRQTEQNEVGSFSCPLPNIISNCQKYYPMGATSNGTRISLTLETIANAFCPAAGAVAADAANFVLANAGIVVPTEVILSDIVLSYQMVMLSPEAENEVLSRPIMLKTQSFMTTANTIPLGSAGAVDLIYSHKVASLKSLFMLCSSPVGVNGKFSAYDIWGPQGDIQFGVASKPYPARPLSFAVGSKTMVMSSLKQAMGSIYDRANSFSINNGEFSRTLALADTAISPAKCYVGVNTEICPSNSVLLSGISTQESSITCRMNLTAATTATVSAMLVSAFDVVIEIDPSTKSVVVRK